MKIFPELDEVKSAAASGDYTVFPVKAEMLADFTTPTEVLRILKKADRHAFLLESAKKNDEWGRYSFLGFEPQMEVVYRDGKFTAEGKTVTVANPIDEIRKILRRYRAPRLSYMPPFTGGLMGYFAYDFFGIVEPKAKLADAPEDENFRDVDLMLFDKVIAFDHGRQKIIIVVNVKLTGDTEREYERATAELKRLAKLIKNGEKATDTAGSLRGDVAPLHSREEFCAMVRKAKEYIYAGDIFQVVLSNRLTAPFEGSLFDAYRILRTVNPSPYMFYFSGLDAEVAGASPETLVKLTDGILRTFPLAGTRPRGKTAEEDEAFWEELLADEKELAEHNMLVDLGRNDLGKISEFGTVKIEKLRSVEKFSHVMHIGSTVKGKLAPQYDALDAIAAVLPAGTLSGAPKIRAAEIIGELEGKRRGIYGGAIGYLDFTGNMDTCIAIRLVYRKNNRVYVQSGAGIVADSAPEKEYEECINKAKAVVTALKEAATADEI